MTVETIRTTNKKDATTLVTGISHQTTRIWFHQIGFTIFELAKAGSCLRRRFTQQPLILSRAVAKIGRRNPRSKKRYQLHREVVESHEVVEFLSLPSGAKGHREGVSLGYFMEMGRKKAKKRNKGRYVDNEQPKGRTCRHGGKKARKNVCLKAKVR